MNMSINRHLISLMSFVFVTSNLVVWLPLLLLAAIVRFVVPVGIVEKAAYQVVESVFRLAVNIDAWWISNVLEFELEIEDHMDVPGGLSHSESPVSFVTTSPGSIFFCCRP
jgi:hypothetical protein